MLSDTDILHALASGDIAIEPFTPELLQPASVDVRLGSKFLVWSAAERWPNNGALSPCTDTITMEDFNVIDLGKGGSGGTLIIEPGDVVLAHTVEQVTLGKMHVGRVEGKSTLGRFGLLVHLTAGFIDPGFDGEITLELASLNARPIALVPGMPIAQLSFTRLDSAPMNMYGSKEVGSHYQGQQGPVPPRRIRWSG